MGGGDFQKGGKNETCDHCGTEGGTFTLIRNDLNEVVQDQRLGSHNMNITFSRKPGIDSLFGNLETNIFSSIDEIGKALIGRNHDWVSKLSTASLNKLESNEGLIEVMHFLGDKIQYNRLLLSLPSNWEKQLQGFYEKVSRGRSVHVHPAQQAANVSNMMKQGRGGTFNTGTFNTEWFTDTSKEEAIPLIHNMIIEASGGFRQDNFTLEEINKIADSIYTSLSNRGVKKIGNWEENYAKNSPLSISQPNLLSKQFNYENLFEGVKYCDHCGAEQSRSLMYSGLFIPFAGEENEEKNVVNYFGRIQDIETEVLPLIQNLWEEQVEEFNRRDKKATKMWDSAGDRLKKKQEDEQKRKRQAEIAELENKLKSLKNNDK